jgi:DNA-binding NtrC family response regulator
LLPVTLRPPSLEPPHTDVIPAMRTAHVFRRFRVVVAAGPDQGVVHDAESSTVTIGTAEGNSLRLGDPTVSRHHAVIEASGGRYVLRDLDSTNGTTLQGCRVDQVVLRPGTRLGFGSTVLCFECLDDELREVLSADESFGPLLGRSVAMRRIFALLPKIAASSATVLLEGETGSGKSVIAEAIHQRSPRSAQPFMIIDCGSIPPTLIESELFGHERGAFTGALQTRIGAFEAAAGGTVFLDEIGELPLEMQPKLLRALEERSIRRVGSNQQIRVDVRVVAATHHDLRRDVNKGAFRADLFFRLNVVALRVPPLRERPEDIPLLIRHFYQQMCGQASAEPPVELLSALARKTFPGNVRELRSAIERTLLLGEPEIEAQPDAAAEAPAIDLTVPFRTAKETVVRRWETAYLRELMQQHRGNLSRAARAVRADRSHLRELVRRYGIAVNDDAD